MPTKTTEKTYAPIMEAICAGRYRGSRNADAAIGGPSPGGGAGASQMLTCQISFGVAAAESRSGCRRKIYLRGRNGDIVRSFEDCEYAEVSQRRFVPKPRKGDSVLFALLAFCN